MFDRESCCYSSVRLLPIIPRKKMQAHKTVQTIQKRSFSTYTRVKIVAPCLRVNRGYVPLMRFPYTIMHRPRWLSLKNWVGNDHHTAWNLWYAVFALNFTTAITFGRGAILHYANPFNATVWFDDHVDHFMTLTESNRLFRAPSMYKLAQYKNKTHPLAPGLAGLWMYYEV